MKSPHTRVLTKIIAKGFYREHTGLLLSLFVLIFINFFYTNVLNQTHLTPEQILETALKLVISTVSEPVGVVIFFSIFFIYSLKTWQYVAGRIEGPDVQFLFYSINALSWIRQIQAWSVVHFFMSLPLIILGVYAMIVGVTFGHWIVPLLIPAYLLILNVYSAQYYIGLTNNTVTKPVKSARLTWLKNCPKPLFSLFLFEVLVKKRVTYVITKIASLASIALIFSVFPDSHSDLRLIGIISLCITLTHVILVYHSNEFEIFYLRFTRNFPYSRLQVYSQQVALYSLLLLPEIIWLFLATELTKALIGIFLMLGIMLLYRTILYRIGHNMKYYLRVVFGLFIFFLLINLFGFTALLAISNALTAWILLYRHQYVD